MDFEWEGKRLRRGGRAPTSGGGSSGMIGGPGSALDAPGLRLRRRPPGDSIAAVGCTLPRLRPEDAAPAAISSAILCLVEASRPPAAAPDRALTIASRTSGATEPDRRGGPLGYPMGTSGSISKTGFATTGAGEGSYIGLANVENTGAGATSPAMLSTCSSPREALP